MRSLVLAFLCFAAVSAHAANSGAWAEYQALKANQFTSLTQSAENHLKMAEVANRLGKVDIEVWNYNNAAYDIINEFKVETNYDATTAKIDSDKRDVRKADRESFKASLKAHILLLQNADSKLNNTNVLHKNVSQQKAIESNRSFIRWVNGFVNSKMMSCR